MLRRRLLLSLVLFIFTVAARQRAVEHPGGWVGHAAPVDRFSFSEPSKVTTTALELDLTVDFATRRLSGTSRLAIENLTGTNTLILDTESLTIASVTLDDSTAAAWSLGPVTPYGRALSIGITSATRFVTIAYSTSPSASGLLWNDAAQSFGRQQPYLYSQNEPVSARSWIPLQDTPSVRLTYDATLRVPPGLLALMSAGDNPRTANATGIYQFRMPYRIPSYLIAIAVGRLEFRAFDEKSGVYAEPEMMDDAIHELSYIPQMVEAAERIAGPYPFDRYDVLLMPPTYIVGGMEHPMLNFIHPFSVVSQNDPAAPEPKSLIAHELAHSWAGDSATLATWDDVWLNEGITNYLTNRILESVSGTERSEYAWFLDRQNYQGFVSSVADPALTILHRTVPHPYVGFGATGYIKGGLFIRTIEDLAGREAFDLFLRQYFGKFAYQWVDDRAFVSFLSERLLIGNDALKDALRLDEWLYGTGLPSNVTAPTSSAVWDRVSSRASQFASGASLQSLSPQNWRDYERDLFLQLAATPVRTRMPEVDASLGLSELVTAPTTWLLHAIATNYMPANPQLDRALARGGSNGTILQLYNALNQTPAGRARAQQFFTLYRDRYADDVETSIAQMLASPALSKIAA
jgi:leukotriene-A4 hydrolase